MDHSRVRFFIKNLIYDLDTVRYLLDYDRLKETMPFIVKILDNIDVFRTNYVTDRSGDIFIQDFWDKRQSAGMTFDQMRTHISKYASFHLPLNDEDLDKIEYRAFVKNIFIWADENIYKLRHEVKSPLREWVEQRWLLLTCLSAALVMIIGVVILVHMYNTRDWGLKGDFYQGQKFDKYLYSGIKKTIDFSVPQEMDQRLPNDDFSDRWDGYLLAPQDGDYTISAFGDDGVKVSIDGKPLLNGTWYGGEVFGKVTLTKRAHSITIEHFQVDGPAALKLFWSFAGGKKEIIPAQYLRH